MPKSVAPCPECKFPNLEGAKRCLACGTSLIGLPAMAEELETVAGLPSAIMQDTNKFAVIETPGAPEASATASASSGRHTALSETVIAWLACEALPPIALGPLRKVSLGRSKDCDLILPHKTVSRVHGEVRVEEGDKIVYEDSSSYGSLINGGTVIGVMPLEVGDTLSLGPYDVKLKPAANRMGDVSEEKTQPLDLTPFRTRQASAELMGSLAHNMLVEVLQGFEFNRKSGTLVVRSEQGEGSLTVQAGSPHSAKLGSLEGEDAIFAMLTLTSGSFAFSAHLPDPVEEPLKRPFTTILFEASRRKDEGVGPAGARPSAGD